MMEGGGPVSYEDFEFNNYGKLRNPKLIDDIVEKRLALVDIVKCIGRVLTSESLEIRGRGNDFITWILTCLPVHILNEKELAPVARFFGDRVKDHHSLIPGVLKGMLALIKKSSISGASVSDVLHSIFQFVVCQSQVVQDRYTIYSIFEECAINHMDCVQAMGPDFTFGVIAAIEGETDPKNLRLILSFLPSFLTKLTNIDHLTSDIFEVLSTYFPVDFTSVTKDGICITREDLAGGLSRCLSSTPNLAAECLPLIIEKLDSNLKTAKIDSYALLRQCCCRLSVSSLDPSLGALWKMIRRDLIPPGPPMVQDEALRALSSIIGVLARDESDQTPLNRFMDDIIISIRSLFPKPSDSLFMPSMKILEALCPESQVAKKRVFLELEYLCKIDFSDCEHQSLLAAIIPFLKYHKDAGKSLDTIAMFFLNSAENSSDEVRVLAFIALQQIVDHFIVDERRGQFYKTLLASARFKDCSKSSQEYYNLMRKVAECSAESFIQEFYIAFFSLYQSDENAAEQFFEAVGFVADVPNVTSVIIPHIMTCISTGKHSHLALKSLLFACKAANSPQFFNELVKVHELLTLLIVWNSEVREIGMLSTTAEIVVRIVSNLDKETQENVVTKVMSNDERLFYTLLEDPVKVILFEGLVGGLRRGITIPSIQEVLRVGQEIAKNCECPEARYSAGRLMATVVNKMDETLAVMLLEDIRRELQQVETNSENVIILMSWLLKGSILRSLSGIESWIAEWFTYLNVARLSRLVAVWTKSILTEEQVFLTAKTHCTVKYLYRQRIFGYALELFKSSRLVDTPLKENYYLVLITLAQSVPKAVLKSEASVPLFVAMAMQSSDMDVVGPALGLLKTVLEDKSPIFTENITSLLPALLQFVTYESSSAIRKLALCCVYFAGFYSTHLLLPYKRQVVKALLPCLDDKKRIVRAEATRARSRWCLVGAVGEEVLLNL